MMETFDTKLLYRSIGQRRTHQSVRKLYGDKAWVTDLDIVNELGGHTGCVNALSWSTSGHLLASGSDDTYLNIWEHNPSSVSQPFTLNTSVSTGHHANIFSVKFMPHSGDRTVVTCAGDSEVRVFDLEYGGTNQSGADPISSTRSRRFNDFFHNARWLSEANTNARVYRSHSDRAKRIVTESSPHLFLSCSEDGEVRQWDLRQPSSAYPSPHGARRLGRLRLASTYDDTSGTAPPALISYKHYGLDINTISCSSSQPQYIALGGAHLHCFLHDRRMLGRNIANEAGRPASPNVDANTAGDETMREATKCVRRFAPNNKRKMRPGFRNSGHITACKISDARPNELIASWSGDHVYSFDIVKSPDVRDAEMRAEQAWQDSQRRNRSDRKRKRSAKAETSQSSLGENRATDPVLRRVADDRQEEGHHSVRVRRGNGESEDITVEPGSEAAALDAHDALLTSAQKQANRVATALVRLRKTLFDFTSILDSEQTARMETSSELTPFTSHFTNTLGLACSILPEMEDIMKEWSYPINPTPEQVELQNTLRRNRQSAWRFVQAAGVLARSMGGRLTTMSIAPDPRLNLFDKISPAPRELISNEERFYYDFLKAICLWLEGGATSVLDGFKPSSGTRGSANRFPLEENDTLRIMLEKLKTMLHQLANEDKPVIDLDANQFLVEQERSLFQSQEQGVNAFIRALTNVELKMHQGLSEPGIYSDGATKRVMDKGAAARFWGVRVGRSLLMEAAEGIDYAFVQQAFGGSRLRIIRDTDLVGEDDEMQEALELLTAEIAGGDTPSQSASVSPAVTVPDMATPQTNTGNHPPPAVTLEEVEDTEEGDHSIVLEEDASSANGLSDDDDEDEDDDNYDSDSEGDVEFSFHRSRLNRSQNRATVNLNVPYSSHTRIYKGHCNTRTVKDVNYYGLDDEYVVSGSDDGNFFIWDRKTGQVLNILEGDGEVVNVVQGHPYEPMIACSGIDSTVKIFGSGGNSRERHRAAAGIDVANPGGSVHSSLRHGGRPRRGATTNDESSEDEINTEEADRKLDSDVEEGKEEKVAKNGLKSRKAIQRQYEIMSQNDAERTRGVDDISITDAMLARIAAAIQHRQMQGMGGGLMEITGQGFGGTGGTVVVDQDNCTTM